MGLELYYVAFNDLNSCRSSGWGVGPIPFTAIVDYARAFSFSEEQLADLHYLIREMDRAYIDYLDKKQKAKQKKGKIGRESGKV